MLISKPYKVLILDDEEDLVELVKKRVVANPDFEPFAFTDPTEAYQAAVKERILFGIVDINMPKLYGDQFLEKLHKKCLGFRGFMLTGDPKIMHVNNCMGYGAMGFIYKPFHKDHIERALEEGKKFLDNWNTALKKCHDLKHQ